MALESMLQSLQFVSNLPGAPTSTIKIDESIVQTLERVAEGWKRHADTVRVMAAQILAAAPKRERIEDLN